MATTNDKQVIFSLVNVGKVYPPKKQVLREIYLGFYFGAKIGVLGLNGSGKSSLLRIIAGTDPNYTGEITRSKGYSVGLLEQEPQLDPDKTVKEIVEEGKKELVAMLHEYDAVSNKMGEASPDELEKLLEKQAQLQEKIEAANGWELENVLDLAMDALRCPPPDAKIGVLSGGENGERGGGGASGSVVWRTCCGNWIMWTNICCRTSRRTARQSGARSSRCCADCCVTASGCANAKTSPRRSTDRGSGSSTSA